MTVCHVATEQFELLRLALKLFVGALSMVLAGGVRIEYIWRGNMRDFFCAIRRTQISAAEPEVADAFVECEPRQEAPLSVPNVSISKMELIVRVEMKKKPLEETFRWRESKKKLFELFQNHTLWSIWRNCSDMCISTVWTWWDTIFDLKGYETMLCRNSLAGGVHVAHKKDKITTT